MSHTHARNPGRQGSLAMPDKRGTAARVEGVAAWEALGVQLANPLCDQGQPGQN